MELTDQLYMEYAGVISRAVNHYTRAFPFIDAEELTLQGGLIFCRAAQSFDPAHEKGASFRTYLENQLKALSHVVNKALHGPTLLEGTGDAPVSIESTATFMADDGSYDATADGVALHTKAEYGDGLVDCLDGDLPEVMAPYVDALDDDARAIMYDIVNGELEPNAKTMEHLTRAEKAKERTLSAWKIYKKRYIKLGWNWQRTRTAYDSLKRMLTLYTQDRLPCVLVRP